MALIEIDKEKLCKTLNNLRPREEKNFRFSKLEIFFSFDK